MFDSLILLCPELEARLIRKLLQEWNPSLHFSHCIHKRTLSKLSGRTLAKARIISFEFPDIVPETLLATTGYGAFNLHPGSPAYPGWAPALFAAEDRAPVFGATLHGMTAQVDAGPILGTELKRTQAPYEQHAFEKLAYGAAWALLQRFAPDLAALPNIPVARWQQWQGPRRTRRQAEALKRSQLVG